MNKLPKSAFRYTQPRCDCASTQTTGNQTVRQKNSIPLSRFDFKAIIRTPDKKEQNVLIEIQKSKNPDPIMRFRRYLGKNYIKQETFINAEGKEETRPLPIITIYESGLKRSFIHELHEFH